MDKQLIPILFKNKNDCCGCTACFAICPKQAISMIEDDEGFLYPTIDDNKCIGCGLCVRVCAFKKDKKVSYWTVKSKFKTIGNAKTNVGLKINGLFLKEFYFTRDLVLTQKVSILY